MAASLHLMYEGKFQVTVSVNSDGYTYRLLPYTTTTTTNNGQL